MCNNLSLTYLVCLKVKPNGAANHNINLKICSDHNSSFTYCCIEICYSF
jgi:hypothetical protein